MTFVKAALAVAAITLLAGHVAPSVDDNNRYLKVTPMADGARIAYTVFFGEIPGASERRRLDDNRDGRIDDAEARRFGDRLAADVLAALTIDVDGAPRSVRWHNVDVGLGSDQVRAGAFSVDLVTYVCAGDASRDRHTLRVRDQFRIPRPGEMEVKVEDTPGVTVHRARVGPHEDASHDYRFVGPGGPMSDEGLEVETSASPEAPRLPPGTCDGSNPSSSSSSAPGSLLAWLATGAGVLAVAAVAALAVRRRRARVRD